MILFCCASELGLPEDLSAIEVILYYIIMFMDGPFMGFFSVSSRLFLGLRQNIFPLITQASHQSQFPVHVSPHVQNTSMLNVTLDSSVHSGLMFSSVHIN